MPPLRLLALEAAKIADLAAAHRMHARHSVLDALDMQEPVRQVDLIPAQRAKLGRPQAVPVCDEDHRRVAVPVSAAALSQPNPKPCRAMSRTSKGRTPIFASRTPSRTVRSKTSPNVPAKPTT